MNCAMSAYDDVDGRRVCSTTTYRMAASQIATKAATTITKKFAAVRSWLNVIRAWLLKVLPPDLPAASSLS